MLGAVTVMPKTAGRGTFPNRTSCAGARPLRANRARWLRPVLLSVLATATSAAQIDEDGTSGVAEKPQVTPPVPRQAAARRAKPEVTKAKTHEADKADQGRFEAPAASLLFGPPPPPKDAGLDAAASAAPSAEAAPSAVPSAAPPVAAVSASTSAETPAASAMPPARPREFAVAEVKIRDTLVLRLKLEDGGLEPAERAKRAMRAIQAALEDSNPGSVRTEAREGRTLLFVGARPIVELTHADAQAMGEGSLDLFAASAAARIGDILENERQRSRVSRTALSAAVVVASALAVLYVLRLLGILARKLREFVHRNPEKIPAIHLRSIEVVGPHVLRSAVVVGVGVLKLMMQFGLVFAWLLFSLSLFDATRSMTNKLTALVLDPLSALATRFAALLPLLLLTTIAIVLLVVLLRFVALFFAGVERRETELHWLRPELAAPTSLLIRIGLVVVSLLVLAPLVTGNVDGSLARVGMLSVVVIAAASTPLAANIVVGLVTLYGGRLKLGDEVRVGDHQGTLCEVGLVELRLSTRDGRDLRLPHLVTLVRPLLVASSGATPIRRLIVTAEAPFERLVEILGTDQVFSHPATVGLVRIETALTTVELTPKQPSAAVEQRLLAEVARELTAKQIRLVLAEWQSKA